MSPSHPPGLFSAVHSLCHVTQSASQTSHFAEPLTILYRYCTLPCDGWFVDSVRSSKNHQRNERATTIFHSGRRRKASGFCTLLGLESQGEDDGTCNSGDKMESLSLSEWLIHGPKVSCSFIHTFSVCRLLYTRSRSVCRVEWLSFSLDNATELERWWWRWWCWLACYYQGEMATTWLRGHPSLDRSKRYREASSKNWLQRMN